MIMEVAISLENATDDSGGERKKEGDIIGIRLPGQGVGLKEAKRYLWLRIEGLDTRAEYDVLAESIYEPDEEGTRYDKRQYCIPLAKIKELDSSFDLDKARDTDDLYQPYLVVDGDTYEFVTSELPFQVSGLVFNKETGLYL